MVSLGPNKPFNFKGVVTMMEHLKTALFIAAGVVAFDYVNKNVFKLV